MNFASNQALLDLPQWLTDGYALSILPRIEHRKDNDLKNALLSGDYNNFTSLLLKNHPRRHAFWYYIAVKYKPENVTYFYISHAL